MIQGSEEWLNARAGKITASRFDCIMVNGKDKSGFGKGALSYANEIVTEILTSMPVDSFSNNAMDWGTETEPLARLEYKKETFNNVDEVGFLTLNDWVGCSPDGLIGSDGGLEVKCPFNSTIHLENLISRTIPKKYIPQVQGCMYVTDRKWWDFISFDPRYNLGLKIMIVRVERDQDYIDKLKDRIEKFIQLIKNIKMVVEG